MKPMTYKGYAAKLGYSDGDRLFYGQIAGIRDMITFHGASVDELRSDFESAVDEYIDLCKRDGKEPDKPYSGKISLRISPELHAQVSSVASEKGLSLNQWISDAITRACYS